MRSSQTLKETTAFMRGLFMQTVHKASDKDLSAGL